MRKIPRPRTQTHRLELRLSDQAVARLQALQQRTEAVSYAEIVRAALIVYEDALNGSATDPWAALTKGST